MATVRRNPGRLPGTQDLTPRQYRRLSIVQARLELFLDRRGYEVVSTPTLEDTDLFLRKSGGELAARMYSFTDPGGRRVSLRPELTSSVVRAFVEGSFAGQLPLRLQYCSNVFRYDPDQPGLREFYQFGAELLGASRLAADAEIMAFATQGLTALGVRGHRLRIGHLGVVQKLFDELGVSERARVFILDRMSRLREPGARERLAAEAEGLGVLAEPGLQDLARLARSLSEADAEEMVRGFVGDAARTTVGQRQPEEITRRYLRKLRETGQPEVVGRALAFASELAGLQGAPQQVVPRYAQLLRRWGLDPASLSPLAEVLEELDAYDLGPVPVVVDLAMTRGLAYYTGTVFQLEHRRVRGAPALGGGGRYDGLVKALGGKGDVPALGFAYALERVAALLGKDFGDDDAAVPTRVLVVAAEATMAAAVRTAERLRVQGIPAELDIVSRTEEEAARYARRRGVTTVMRVGRDGDTTEEYL